MHSHQKHIAVGTAPQLKPDAGSGPVRLLAPPGRGWLKSRITSKPLGGLAVTAHHITAARLGADLLPRPLSSCRTIPQP